MNKKIEKVREDIRKTKARIRDLEEYLKTLQMQERQLCDEELAKTIRAMAGKSDVLETLRRIEEARHMVYAENAAEGKEEMSHEV